MDKMRMVLLFDLPAESRHQRKVLREFNEWVFSDGFAELQSRVFTRMTDSLENARLHLKRLRAHKPEQGFVRAIIITERQLQLSEVIAGQNNSQEVEISSQVDIFL